MSLPRCGQVLLALSVWLLVPVILAETAAPAGIGKDLLTGLCVVLLTVVMVLTILDHIS